MATSLYLAKLIGPVMLVIGIGLVVNRTGYHLMAEEFLHSRALIYLAGLLALVPGLALVLAHNVWAADWRIIITLIGWLATIGGVVRILFPQQVTQLGGALLARPAYLPAGGAAVLVLGAILTYCGYFA